jgi:RNA polymerase sigma-70 factor (ECF subfamily)
VLVPFPLDNLAFLASGQMCERALVLAPIHSIQIETQYFFLGAALVIPLGLAVWLDQSERNRQDVDLLRRIQRRDARAFSAFYDRHATILYSLASRILSTTQEAEEVVQDVFLNVWMKADTYVPQRGTVYSWVAALCRNNAIDRLRSKRHKQELKESGLQAPDAVASQNVATEPHRAVAWKEYEEAATAGMRRLTNIEAKLLDMSYYGGYSQAEIAKMLKMPLGTVKTKMRQGIIKLRQAIRTGDEKR